MSKISIKDLQDEINGVSAALALVTEQGPGASVDDDEVVSWAAEAHLDTLRKKLKRIEDETRGDSDVYKTVYRVTVFSDGEFGVSHRDDDPFDLQAINYDITEGDCVGHVEWIRSYQVPQDLLHDELVAIGNDGEFFDYKAVDDGAIADPDAWWNTPWE